MEIKNGIKPAVVIVTYNRPDCVKRLLTSVNNAYYPEDDVVLIVSVDESDRSDEIEKLVKQTGWKHGELVVRRFEQRQGLRNHILQCGDLSQKYGAVIILEDDLLVSPAYYTYMLQALNKYGNDEKIAGISLYSHAWNGYADMEFMPENNGYDTYLGQFSITWGQCWTDRQWTAFKTWYTEHEGKLASYNKIPKDIEYWGDKSWGKYFAYYIVESNCFYVIPYVSLSTNYSEVGEHNSDTDSIHQVMLLECREKEYQFPEISDAVKYDMFFERILEKKDIVAGISGDQICVNLNGTHRDNDGKRYLLTCNRMKGYQCIRTYGLQLRPVERNVLSGVKGNDLFLYDLGGKTVKLKRRRIPAYNRVAYELYGNGWIRVGTYSLGTLGRKIRGLVRK